MFAVLKRFNLVLVSGKVITSDGKSVTIVDKSEVLVTGEVAVNIIKVSEGEKKDHESNTVVVSKEKLTGNNFCSCCNVDQMF